MLGSRLNFYIGFHDYNSEGLVFAVGHYGN